MYKLITGLKVDDLHEHLEKETLLSPKQKGCIRNTYGTKDQLLLNKTILENCKKQGKHLSTSWIDYKKAFDSMPLSYILDVLAIYKADPLITSWVTTSMPRWTVNLQLYHQEGLITIPEAQGKGNLQEVVSGR